MSTTFDVGDKVVYPHHGAAVIQKREKKEVFGTTREYLVLKLAYGDLTARENLLLSARLHGLTAGVAAGAVDTAIGAFGLEPYAEVRVRQLSAGNRQRVGLAAAMQHHPRVVVLDEPTSTLDPAGVLLLRDALRTRRAAGAAVLVSSHHLDEVARIADRITVLNAGRVIGTLDPTGADLEQALAQLA